MEEKPWLKSECFAWHDGRRIVDLYELSKQMQCKQCRSLLDLRRTERETRFGLASVLYIACHCGVMNDVHTGRKQESGSDHCMANGGDGGNMYEVNIKASINLLMYGVGASRFLSFLALLDIPVPPPEDTSLIVPVTDDSGPMIGAPPSNVPQNPPAFNAQTGYAAPQSGYNIPQSGYNYDVQPSSQAYNVPPQSLTSVSYQQMGPSASFMSGGLSTPATCMPQTSASVTPTKELKVKDLAEASGDCQDVMFASPPDDDDGDELEKAVTRPVAGKSKAAGVKQKGQIVKRGRGRGRGSTPRKTPSATQTSAKKKKVESSDEEFVNPLEWPTSESESESDGKNSDTSWHASDQELGRKKSASKRKSKDEDDKQEEEGEEEGEEEEGEEEGEEEEEKDEGENESDIEETDDSPKKGKRGRGRKKTKSDGGSGSSKTKKRRIRHERRQEEADNAPKCPDCDKIFSSIKSYNQHMKRVHDKEVKETVVGVADVVYVCSLCGQPFPCASSLPWHLRYKHRVHDVKENSLEISMEEAFIKCTQDFLEGEYYQCLTCHAYIPNRERVSAHIRIASDKTMSCKKHCKHGMKMKPWMYGLSAADGLAGEQKSILCPQCGLTFRDKVALGKHKRSAHLVKKYVCEVCSYATAHKRNLIRHHWAMHTRQPNCPRPFICEQCGNSFMDKVSLSNHKRVHKPKTHLCHLCPQACQTKFALDKHMRSHTGEHPYLCADCGQSFTEKYNLKVHRRIHTGERPYRCKLCEAAFAQKASLNVHMKKHQKHGPLLNMNTHSHHTSGTSSHKPPKSSHRTSLGAETGAPLNPLVHAGASTDYGTSACMHKRVNIDADYPSVSTSSSSHGHSASKSSHSSLFDIDTACLGVNSRQAASVLSSDQLPDQAIADRYPHGQSVDRSSTDALSHGVLAGSTSHSSRKLPTSPQFLRDSGRGHYGSQRNLSAHDSLWSASNVL